MRMPRSTVSLSFECDCDLEATLGGDFVVPGRHVSLIEFSLDPSQSPEHFIVGRTVPNRNGDEPVPLN
jgi:hypothetical protein